MKCSGSGTFVQWVRAELRFNFLYPDYNQYPPSGAVMAPGPANTPCLKLTSFWQLYDHVYVPIADKSKYLSYT